MAKKWFCFVICSVLVLFCTSCTTPGETPDQPVVVTIWHVYGAQTDSPLNDMISTFNQTVGKEQGIQVEVTLVSNNKNIHEAILSSAYGDPGASVLPDMFVAYPKTVLAMPDDSILLNYRDYFSEAECAAFVPAFIEEGMINGRLAVLPVAKSTEIMYINKTLFDRFASDTGTTVESLSTWECLFEAAEKYAAWTDGQTPETAGDAKALLVHDFHFNYFQVGVKSLGESFFDDAGIAFGEKFSTVWEPYARAALSGGLWLKGGYATEPLRTADSIVSIASSASVLYFSDIVTYPNNTSEEVEWIIRPCPVFKNGSKLVMQRGAGICTVKSTPEREEACITFLKWLTDAQRNVEFVTQAGYMPVKQESFDAYLSSAIQSLTDEKYIQLYDAFLETQAQYTFYTAPQTEWYLDLETKFENNIRLHLGISRNACLAAGDTAQETLLTQLVWDCYDDFRSTFN